MENKRRRYFFWLISSVVFGTIIPLLIYNANRTTTTPTTTTNNTTASTSTFASTTTTTTVPTTTTGSTTTSPPTTSPSGCILQPPPLIPPICDPLYNLSYYDSYTLTFDGAPLRFVYDTNFRRPVYIYQTLDYSIVVVTPTWNYTLNNTAFTSIYIYTTYLLIDCSSNVYVLYSFYDPSNSAIKNTTLCKIDPYGVLQYCSFIATADRSFSPILEDGYIWFLADGVVVSPLAKIDILNGNVTFLQYQATASQTLIKNGDRLYMLFPVGITGRTTINATDLDGNILNYSVPIRYNNFAVVANSTNNYIYVIGSIEIFTNTFQPYFRKYDRNLALVWETALGPISITYAFANPANKIFVNNSKVYYLGLTNNTDPAPYLDVFSDIDGTFIERKYHPFAAHTGDYTLTFDSLSNSVYFLAIQDPYYQYSPTKPIYSAINTFCI